ncbi:MAG: type IX secretion system sortase PorU [Bacteroidales bacterium]
MKRNYNISSFFLIFVLITIFSSQYSNAFESDTLYFDIKWEGVKSYVIDENNSIDYLSFKESSYIGNPEGIEVFSHQFSLDIPHFRPEIELIPGEIINVTAKEESFLKKLGYKEENFSQQRIFETARKKSSLNYVLVPVRYNKISDSYEKLLSFSIAYEYIYDSELTYVPKHEYADNSVLASGDWYKVCVDKSGVYQLDYNDLVEMGIDPAQVQKSKIAIYGNGGGMLPESNEEERPDDLIENAIYVSGSSGNFGQSDYILFYGESPHEVYYDEEQSLFRHQMHLYAEESCYFLTTNADSGKRIQSRPSTPDAATHQATTFQDYAFHERDLYNLIGSGRIWYGELFDVTLERSFDFSFPNIDNSEKVYVTADVAARSSVGSTFTLKSGSTSGNIYVQPINPTAVTSFYAKGANGSIYFFPGTGSNITVDLKYNRSETGARGWLNYIAVNATRKLIFHGSQMQFRNANVVGVNNITQFSMNNADSQITIWDVSDTYNIVEQEYSISGGQASFKVETEEIKEFVAYNGTAFLTPSLKGKVNNQNLHAAANVDMIIICPDEFRDEAERLADFRYENDGISSAIYSPQQVYNEFSSGVQDISAIRNFMKMFYDNADGGDNYPKYLLLFGNGTYDNRDILDYGGNFIPTFQTESSLNKSESWMTDDYYGLLDDDEGEGAAGILDIGIGRLPVRTAEQAEDIVDKIIRYDERIEGWEPGSDDLQWVGKISNYADWRNLISLIADDEDNNTHYKDSEKLAEILENEYPVYNVEKIYLDSYEQITMAGGSRYPEVNKSINNRVNQGALLVNYIGHGGKLGLAHERVVTFADINTWNNKYNMPVFMTATCEFSAFDIPSPEDLSAGVRIFLKNQGGAIALFTTTRLAWSGSNFTLNERFFNNAFVEMADGKMPRLGDLLRLSKTSSDNVKNFVLLGDPSMQMAYPRYQVVTESLPDTIRAFQEVTVNGYIADEYGNLAENYNGVVFPKVYDKSKVYTTYGNDPGSSSDTFLMQNSIIYKGKASVNNGEFSFSFIVPKDIVYSYGEGKLSYYADDGMIDASGYSFDFVVGGTSLDYEPDNEGPVINLFMNDTTFVSGDNTDENPVLLSFLFDESGINVTGNIGHGLIAFLNDDRANSIVLNQYYEADLDTYKSGKIAYPFYSLPDGNHKVTLRAWDVHNNFSEESINFVVSSSAELALYEIMNYPNPFNIYTNFVFKHNLPAEELHVSIDIYNLSGQLIKNLQENILSYGYQSPPIHWDGNDNGGRPIDSGVYIYRIVVSTERGGKVSGSNRLVIIR